MIDDVEETAVSRVVTRRTQEERSSATRELLLQATVSCLVDLGYAGTTTTEIAERAGVSRGAQLHHFPTKVDLVVSAIEHLAHRRGAELARKVAKLPTAGNRLSPAIELLWESFSSPLFYAALELWVAARTDPDLLEAFGAVETRLARSLQEQWLETLRAAAGIGEREAGAALALTISVMEGMALNRILQPDPKGERRMLDLLKSMLSGVLGGGRAR